MKIGVALSGGPRAGRGGDAALVEPSGEVLAPGKELLAVRVQALLAILRLIANDNVHVRMAPVTMERHHVVVSLESLLHESPRRRAHRLGVGARRHREHEIGRLLRRTLLALGEILASRMRPWDPAPRYFPHREFLMDVLRGPEHLSVLRLDFRTDLLLRLSVLHEVFHVRPDRGN